ncbi:glutathione S-transferase family protein [Stenotrophomonas sp. GZD-301]|uniref:glutathione S-transferase family protein n=1 Tax=Stenotrophomonas sp. GZD-301 TaxID=3404814 RepID=UPI003BB74766
MPNPILHVHPLSSCCQKVLIAAHVLGVSLDTRLLNLGDPVERAAFRALWPLGKMPLLVEQGTCVGETSIIIEYLQLHHAAEGARLIPQDPAQALQVRFWDRVCDLYVMTPMQALTAALLQPDGDGGGAATEAARATLLNSYALLDRQLEGRPWLAGDSFSLADCAAAPALFYAVAYVPLPASHAALSAYVERLMAHAPVAAVIDAARPWFKYFPGRAGLSRRYYDPEA